MISLHKNRAGLRRVAAALAAGALASVLALPPASAYPGGPWFVPNKPYVTTSQWVPGHDITIGDLADPDILLDNGTYYAYGTNGGGRNVPLITSTDLVNWTTNKSYRPPATSPDGRPVLNAADHHYNDTLALPGSWALRNEGCNTRISGCYEIWAPSVEKVSSGNYIMAYAAKIKPTTSNERWCIGLARGSKPTGPFFDTASTPFVCSDDPKGAIDPDLYKDANGKLYLYWKNEGNAAQNTRTKIWVRELNAQGTGWAAGSQAKALLETLPVKSGPARDWKWFETFEKPLIENPSMVRWQNQHYLFYSASTWDSPNYRTGYALCEGPTGPCQRGTHTPLLTTDSTWGIGGPGGATGFVDKTGQLRLAYAAWRHDRAGYDCTQQAVFFENQKACTSNQRFFHVATLSAFGPNRLLAATTKSNFPWAAPSKPSPISFRDTAGSVFSAEINWLAHTGVTTGWQEAGGRNYRPTESVNRDVMAAFLYRLAGSPDYTAPKTSPFKDVPVSHVFYKEISWLATTGVSKGWDDGTFRPNDAISREQMAAFMYRLAGSPAATGQHSFKDVTVSPFKAEIAWTSSQGISRGWNDGTFRPTQQVTREQMAAFMYRLTQKTPMIAYTS